VEDPHAHPGVAAQLSRIKAAIPQVLLTSTVGPAFGTELHGVTDAGLCTVLRASTGSTIFAMDRATASDRMRSS
jgi:hypothetical protein